MLIYYKMASLKKIKEEGKLVTLLRQTYHVPEA